MSVAAAEHTLKVPAQNFDTPGILFQVLQLPGVDVGTVVEDGGQDHAGHIVAETAGFILTACQNEGKKAALVNDQGSASTSVFIENLLEQHILGLHMALDGLAVVLVVHGFTDVLRHKIDGG